MNHGATRSSSRSKLLSQVLAGVVAIGVGIFGCTQVFNSSALSNGQTSAQLFSGMPLALDEEFAGNTLNPAIWTTKNNVKASNNEAYWMSSNVVVNNGLQILADQNQNGHAYEAGDLQTYPNKWMTSNNYFGAEVRAKLPLEAGFWPAPLWFRPVTSSGSVTDGEIDMMEAYGKENPNFKLHGTLHGTYTPSVQSAKATLYSSFGLDPYAYHTWQMVKIPGSHTMYVDGIQYAQWTSTSTDSNYWAPFSQYMEASGVRWGMRITTQIGGSYGLPDSTTDWSPAKTTMSISYVKVYNYSPPASGAPSNPSASNPPATTTQSSSPAPAAPSTTSVTSKPVTATATSPAPSTKTATIRTATGQPVTAVGASATVTATDTITLDSSTVTDPAVTKQIKQVTFYKDGLLLLKVTAAPFVLDLKKVSAEKLPNGTQRITQRTYYADGHTTEKSQMITISGQPVAVVKPASRGPVVVGSLSTVTLLGALIWFFILRRRNQLFICLRHKEQSATTVSIGHPDNSFYSKQPPNLPPVHMPGAIIQPTETPRDTRIT